MKKILLILIITFSLQSWAKAEDISDFEIEGMSIGDSLLDYFDINTIENSRKYEYKNDKFYSVDIWDDKFKLFQALQFHLKKNDKKYIIHGLSGALTFGEEGVYYPNSEKECKKQKQIIEKDISGIFSNAEKYSEYAVGQGDYDPKVIRQDTYYLLNTGEVWIQCVTWGKKAKKKHNIMDNLRLTIVTPEFEKWMTTEAY